MRNYDSAGGYAPYYEYVMSFVGGAEWWDEYADNMLRLFERKYYWKHPIDENWKGHVESFRVGAMKSGILPIYILQGEPSVLEVLVCLSQHVARSIMWSEDTGDTYNERIPEYFNDMVRALSFDCDIQNIDAAIDSFLNGETMLAGYEIDRRLTLWEQANLYFADQFRIENE